MNEDVFPIENGDFPMSCSFSGVYITCWINQPTILRNCEFFQTCWWLKGATELKVFHGNPAPQVGTSVNATSPPPVKFVASGTRNLFEAINRERLFSIGTTFSRGNSHTKRVGKIDEKMIQKNSLLLFMVGIAWGSTTWLAAWFGSLGIHLEAPGFPAASQPFWRKVVTLHATRHTRVVVVVHRRPPRRWKLKLRRSWNRLGWPITRGGEAKKGHLSHEKYPGWLDYIGDYTT